ncbi:OmpH family outer membrane protein [Chitinophaga sp. Cy-1792]|uniref:OmpH family outer membrane protein n=1 Tax=Chitinophaga sp. Cy-1792 TaxID=2608339 RepID=UPI001420B993|nr:OmpH family outer membrane protein [Chitinophaga sp. Cy-1792]NIG57104.1 OmpH family outer membrane protein [Chitinophaga sp. Cy-1792]
MRTRNQFVSKGLMATLAAGLFVACQNNKQAGTAPAANTNTAAPTAASFKIAYVDLDTLEAHFEYFKLKRAELEKKQQSMDNTLQAKMRSLQNEFEDLQRKAATLTQEQGENIQRGILAKKQQLEQEAQQMRGQYAEQEAKFNEELQGRLDTFLENFNKDKRFAYIFSYRKGASNILYKDSSFDITTDVIKGMNELGAAAGATPAK